MSPPFQTVTGPAGDQTHLVLHPPAMPGHTPGQRSYATLCGGRAGAPVPVGPGDVDCLSCLSATPHLMMPPAFEVRP